MKAMIEGTETKPIERVVKVSARKRASSADNQASPQANAKIVPVRRADSLAVSLTPNKKPYISVSVAK